MDGARGLWGIVRAIRGYKGGWNREYEGKSFPLSETKFIPRWDRPVSMPIIV